ncbi:MULTISPECIES: ABC transporter permease [Delftia]|jgi:lipopolysaccharide transport system permease protein|uniref:ABC transporter permease n=1 Tax=Delftia TaxID=80865 RepID=UPI0005556B66|nr:MULTISPECIES: ABC transporter permease [Delftia]KZK25769.1 ABC transporter [Delftia sp. GW456-R20]MDH0418682.1 ABC transporter permease [Delftia tsuruhatensis]QQB49318.1 ABC transporter permease [Delftia acidovorans]
MPGLAMLRALWAYRGFVWSSVMREFHGKYRESLLGAFWSVANPLTMIIIYTVVFGQLMRPTLPGHEQMPFAFSIYLCAGVTTWGLFSEMLMRLNSVFLEHGNLIKKSNFPRICLPVIVTISSLINFGIVFFLYLVFLAIIGHWPGWSLLALIPLLALQLLFTLGLGVLLGTLNVFFRDVGQLTGVVLQFWFWLTPIVYTLPALPQQVRDAMRFNPMHPLIAAYQQIFLDKTTPDFGSLLPLCGLTMIFIFMGAKFFLNRVGELVDEL